MKINDNLKKLGDPKRTTTANRVARPASRN